MRKKLRALWEPLRVDVDRRVRLGRLLGLGFVAAGFVLIGLAWNGAASIAWRVDSQFPYLLSGGFAGVGLIVVGAVLLLLAGLRAERQVLTARFDEMATLLARNLARLSFSPNGGATDGQVVVGINAYHRAGCRILEGKQGLTAVTVEQAASEGLVPCRVCDPPPPPVRTDRVTEASERPAR